jgi:protein-S-isoprenylcysteine O-methyltransferase Ste14
VISPHRAIGLLWTAWVVSWMIAAVWSHRSVWRESMWGRAQYGAPIWIGAYVLFRQPAILGPLTHLIYPVSSPFAWLAASVVALGIAWTWWARIHLGKLWSGNIDLKAGHVVVRSGPYRLSRHPIYSGLLLALLATAVSEGTWAAFIGWALIVTGFVMKLRREERLLLTQLGAEYDSYRSAVPALVPRPW